MKIRFFEGEVFAASRQYVGISVLFTLFSTLKLCSEKELVDDSNSYILTLTKKVLTLEKIFISHRVLIFKYIN